MLLISNRFDEHDKNLFGSTSKIIEARGTVQRSILKEGLPCVLKKRDSPLRSLLEAEKWLSERFVRTSFTPDAGSMTGGNPMLPDRRTDCGIVGFLYTFTMACYGLFGDEMLSLRFVEPVLNTWFTEQPSDSGNTKLLCKALLDKQSYLPPRFVYQFVDTV